MSERTSSSEPKCDRCQTPMERYAVPGTGGKEQSWRLACPCQHSATPDVARTSNGNNDPLLIKALRELLDHYVGLVNSGDAGNWDPEKEGEVAQARAALRLANAAPYMNSPIECNHRLARLVCPDCGINLRGNVLNTSETCEDFAMIGGKRYPVKFEGYDRHTYSHRVGCLAYNFGSGPCQCGAAERAGRVFDVHIPPRDSQKAKVQRCVCGEAVIPDGELRVEVGTTTHRLAGPCFQTPPESEGDQRA